MWSRFGDDVTLLPALHRVDSRGRLSAIDVDHVPFPVRRVFTVTDVPAGCERGGHRHRRGVQALFCVAGRVDVELRVGDVDHVEVLTPESGGLCIAAGVWARQRYVDEGSQLLVLASEPFDRASYDTSY